MDTKGFAWKSICHIVHQNNSFGSRLQGTSDSVAVLPQWFFWFVCLFVSFSFLFFNDERSNLRCVVPRSAWLCCLVSVKTLKSYFTLHNAHFLSFSTHFISLFIRPWQSNIIISPQKENEWEDDADKRRKRNVTRGNFQPTHQKKSQVALSINVN